MIINGFIDESEDEDFFVMAGFVAPADEWAKFSDAWKLVLDDIPKVPMLKTAQAMATPPRGPFWGLTAEQRDKKLSALYDVIDAHVSFGVSSVIHMKPLKDIFGNGEFPKQAMNPFYHGIFALLDGVVRRQIECKMPEKIDFIFDERVREQGKVLAIWDAVVHDAPEYFKSMVGATPTFKSDDDVLPLQAADLEAWWLRRRLSEKARNLPRLEYPWNPAAIPELISVMGGEELYVKYQKMLKSRADLAILGIDV